MLIYQFSKMERLDAWRVKLSPPFWGQSAGFVAAAPSILQSGTLSEERRRRVHVPSNRPWPWSRAASCLVHFAKDTLCACVLPFPLHPFLSSWSPSVSPFTHTLPLSFPPSLFSLSLSFCSLSPSLARLFQYSIFIIRFQLLVSRIVWLGRVRSHSIE